MINPRLTTMQLVVDPTQPIPASMTNKARQLVRELRQEYAATLEARDPREPMTAPPGVAHFMAPLLAPLHVECFYVLPLDVRSRLIGEPLRLTQGDVDGTDAHPRNFFRAALKAEAVTCIAVHNHPSGDVLPSSADIAVTRQLAKAGRMLGLQLVDHIIIGACGAYTSLRQEHGHIFNEGGE